MPVRKSFWEFFWLAKLLFQATGILPIGGSPSLWKSILTGLLMLCPLLHASYLLMQPMDYILFRTHDMDDLLESVIFSIAPVGAVLRLVFLIYNHHRIVRLFSVCRKLWDQATSRDYILILTWAERARLFITTYFCAGQLTTAMFAFTAIFRQFSSTVNSTRTYYPFGFEDFDRSSHYEIKYALQVICGQVAIMFVSASDTVGTLLALIMCGQLALIRSWLSEVSKKKFNAEKEKLNKRLEVLLVKCIRRHQIVLDFCAKLEEVVHCINLSQVITGMYIMAISASRLTQNIGSYRFYATMLLAIIGLFCSCWPAENLSLASSKVTHAVYEVPWYNSPPRERIVVLMMLARSQRPLILTAGKFAPLSMETFSSILCNGISFCMVLNQL